MTKKTILIVGQSGPQGKTTLCNELKKLGYKALEMFENELPSNPEEKGWYRDGWRNGFIKINFKNKPTLRRINYDYVMSKEELDKYVYYIEVEYPEVENKFKNFVNSKKGFRFFSLEKVDESYDTSFYKGYAWSINAGQVYTYEYDLLYYETPCEKVVKIKDWKEL